MNQTHHLWIRWAPSRIRCITYWIKCNSDWIRNCTSPSKSSKYYPHYKFGMAASPIRFNRRHVKAAITFKQLPAETNSIYHLLADQRVEQERPVFPVPLTTLLPHGSPFSQNMLRWGRQGQRGLQIRARGEPSGDLRQQTSRGPSGDRSILLNLHSS